MADDYFYEVANGHGLPHDPFKAMVAPRPIGWISSVDRQGRVNLAPYSFFNAVSDTPPVVMFSSSGWKHSIRNVEATGEFVANVACRGLAAAMNRTSAPVPEGVNEMELAGLAAAPCRLVRPPRVADAPAALECRLLKIERLAALDGTPIDNFIAFGQVVAVHIDRTFLKDGRFDTGAAHPIMRAGYRGDYVEARPDTMFEMIRPTLDEL